MFRIKICSGINTRSELPSLYGFWSKAATSASPQVMQPLVLSTLSKGKKKIFEKDTQKAKKKRGGGPEILLNVIQN